MESHLNKYREMKTMQALKNIVISGAMSLALLFGMMVSATALSASDFEYHKTKAEQGDVLYQNVLGDYYAFGLGVRQDYAKALYWYQKSADQENASGQFSVGYAYYNGTGVRQDYGKGLEWLKKSAAQNNEPAQHSLGLIYEFGKGVRQNKNIAKEWYGKSCDNGYQGGCDDYKRLNEEGY